MSIEKEVSLKNYNTMEIDSVARYFSKIKKEKDLIDTITWAKQESIPFIVIGGGSNIIFPSRYEGLVILIDMVDFKIEEKDGFIFFEGKAGLSLPYVARMVSERLGKGMEWAGGVPGTVGGAVRGNAGAFGDFMEGCVKSVEALNTDTLEKEVFENHECQFGYRESIFKKEKNYIITKVEMKFPKKEEDGKLKEYLKYRKDNHPEEPSSGSIFKNPVVDEGFYDKFEETEKFKKLGFVPMRFLVESCGLKGKQQGGAKISEKHANFIINIDGATGDDVKFLINLVKEKVKEKYEIDVKEEVEII